MQIGVAIGIWIIKVLLIPIAAWFGIPGKLFSKGKIIGMIGTIIFVFVNIALVGLILSPFVIKNYTANGTKYNGVQNAYIASDSAKAGDVIVYNENQMSTVSDTYRTQDSTRYAVLENGETITFEQINGHYYKSYNRKNTFLEKDAENSIAYDNMSVPQMLLYYAKGYMMYEENDFTFIDRIKGGILGVWYQMGDIVSFFSNKSSSLKEMNETLENLE